MTEKSQNLLRYTIIQPWTMIIMIMMMLLMMIFLAMIGNFQGLTVTTDEGGKVIVSINFFGLYKLFFRATVLLLENVT